MGSDREAGVGGGEWVCVHPAMSEAGWLLLMRASRVLVRCTEFLGELAS